MTAVLYRAPECRVELQRITLSSLAPGDGEESEWRRKPNVYYKQEAGGRRLRRAVFCVVVSLLMCRCRCRRRGRAVRGKAMGRRWGCKDVQRRRRRGWRAGSSRCRRRWRSRRLRKDGRSLLIRAEDKNLQRWCGVAGRGACMLQCRRGRDSGRSGRQHPL